MNILAIDTSGPGAGVALMQQCAISHETKARHGLTHSQTIMLMVDQALGAASLEPDAVDLFAVVAGPGSFTGVRIGVCAARGLAHATDRRLIGVNALEALAAGAFGFDGMICPILDARRGQVYGAAFSFANGSAPNRLMPDVALPLDEYLSALPGDGLRLRLFLGDGLCAHAGAIRSSMGEGAVIAPGHMAFPRAASVCYLAGLRADGAGDYRSVVPIYLRKPQAEREREARSAGGV